MALTGEEIKVAFEVNPTTTAHALGEVLRDFGYTTLGDAYVEAEIKRLLDGGEPKAGPSMFLSRWLKDGIE